MSKMNIMKHVDLAELGSVEVHYLGKGNIAAYFVPLDSTKKLVVDSSALKTLNQKITEACEGKDPHDPKVKQYISEYVHRMFSALHRQGLCELVDVEEGKDDWYKDHRN